MSRRRNRGPTGTPERWISHAESDLALIHLSDGHPEVHPELRGFHAQQAAEKR
ncbi:MAG: hypothetical protein ACRDZ4_13320 [Egibacteraceae bacterium]